MKEVVLVHGAFQGGWVWDEVADELRSLGWRVHAPTLSGCGYLGRRMRLDTGLADWVDDVAEYIRLHTTGAVVLAGTSFAGLICGAVIMREPLRVCRGVFIDAVLPLSRHSFVDLAGPSFKRMLEGHTREDGLVSPWQPAVFGVPTDEWPRFAGRLAAFPRQAFTAPFNGTFDPHLVKCAFIACTLTENPFIRSMRRRASEYGWPVRELQSGHSPMVTHPRPLASLIHESALDIAC